MQEIEQIGANVFYSTFTNVLVFLFFSSIFTFFNVFEIFIRNVYYVYVQVVNRTEAIPARCQVGLAVWPFAKSSTVS